MTAWAGVIMAAVLMSALFAIAWVLARRRDNYSLVDAVWAFGIGLTGWLWLAVCGEWSVKHVLAGVLLAIWSMRLTWHLQRRIRKAHPDEDSRYTKLRALWHGHEASAFFWFFQAQAVSVVLLALPFLWISRDVHGSLGVWEWVGCSTVFIGVWGESVADAQMVRFKKTNSAANAVCQDGWWRLSRHPNYFFEAVIWCGFYLYACGSAWGWATVHAPVTIIYLLLKVTGIPPTEASAVQRKGDAYRIYQKTTSAFIPWPPKSTH